MGRGLIFKHQGSVTMRSNLMLDATADTAAATDVQCSYTLKLCSDQTNKSEHKDGILLDVCSLFFDVFVAISVKLTDYS